MRAINIAAATLIAVWVIAGVFTRMANERGQDIPFAQTVWAELKPFFLPALVVTTFFDVATLDGWGLFFDAVNVGNWYFLRNAGDDDRWKRRKEKLAGKVQALASGRLVVVPAGAS